MSDDYLWDKSGTPDPSVEALERALAPLRHREGALELAPPVAPQVVAPRRLPRRAIALATLAAAAGLAIAAGSVWRADRPGTTPETSVQATVEPSAEPTLPQVPERGEGAWFGVTRVAGAPLCDSRSMTGDCQLHVGEWLETGEDARADIAIATIGHVRVGPGSRVRLSETGPSQHVLDLVRGRIEAKVDAPPRLFQVAMPAAVAVDLGCAYALDVRDGGDGVLAVTSGYVSLEWKARTSLVPAGARCEMKRDLGPGTPYFADAKPALVAAVRAFDFESGGEASVVHVLEAARGKDSLTLWHLLFRVDDTVRPRVVQRLKKLVPPPPTVTEADALARDVARLEPWKARMRRTW